MELELEVKLCELCHDVSRAGARAGGVRREARGAEKQASCQANVESSHESMTPPRQDYVIYFYFSQITYKLRLKQEGKTFKLIVMHIALYRKYRPQKFSDVIDQEHVVKALSEQLKNNELAHAYLFSGGRGTGKTSVARILAKELKTSEEDLYEIDAASNRGIDDIRAIRDVIHIRPFRSEYKIYIIDEAHMLTKEAWNALLKTIEEPPRHVIFILATTEPHKVPDTIISRCQTFEFKRPDRKTLAKVVEKVAKAEKFSIPKEAVEHIALLGDSSYRDTLGMLEKVISASKDNKITLDEVLAQTGIPDTKLVLDIISGTVSKDGDKALSALHTISEKGGDMGILLLLILERLRLLLLLRFAPKTAEKLSDSVSKDDMETLKKIAEDTEVKLNSETILPFLEANRKISFSAIPSLPIELAILEIVEK